MFTVCLIFCLYMLPSVGLIFIKARAYLLKLKHFFLDLFTNRESVNKDQVRDDFHDQPSALKYRKD